MIGALLFPDRWRAWTRADAVRELTALRAAGVDTIVTETEDHRDDVIAWAHELGLAWMAAVACFSDHASGNALLRERPELWPVTEHGRRRQPMEWYVGLSPASAALRAERLAAIERVASAHEIDGLFLDFVRWPLHWELECRPDAPAPATASFDDLAVDAFAASSGVAVPAAADPGARARWILAHEREAWEAFRCRVVTDFVAEAAARVRAVRRVPVGAFVVPLPPERLRALVGQDLGALAPHLDWLAPMTYHAMLHRDADWVERILAEHEPAAPAQVVAVLQADADGSAFGADWGPPIAADEWRGVVAAARRACVGGSLIVFPGDALLDAARGHALASTQSSRKARR